MIHSHCVLGYCIPTCLRKLHVLVAEIMASVSRKKSVVWSFYSLKEIQSLPYALVGKKFYMTRQPKTQYIKLGGLSQALFSIVKIMQSLRTNSEQKTQVTANKFSKGHAADAKGE